MLLLIDFNDMILKRFVKKDCFIDDLWLLVVFDVSTTNHEWTGRDW